MAFHHWMSTQSAHQNLRGHGRQAGRPVSLAHIEREIADMIAKENDAHAPRVQKIDACWEANEDPNAHLTGSPLDMLICSSWLMHSSIPSTIIFPGLPGKPVLLVLLTCYPSCPSSRNLRWTAKRWHQCTGLFGHKARFAFRVCLKIRKFICVRTKI